MDNPQERGDELKVKRYRIEARPTKNRPYGWSVSVGKLSLQLGQHYWLDDHYCRFIRVTTKGFNLLDEATNRCVLYPHLYAVGFGGKPLPADQDTFVFWVPANLRLCSVKQATG